MTDLELNIALAEAMGWKPASKYAVMYGQYDVNRKIVYCNDNGILRKFDYRDPVIFAAICKRWGVDVADAGDTFFARIYYTGYTYLARTPEYAAAWCVIDLLKRGLK